MGILTLEQGGKYAISSDRSITDTPVNRPPKGKVSDNYEVWTGQGWSVGQADAMTFGTLDEADEYVRANYRRLSGN